MVKKNKRFLADEKFWCREFAKETKDAAVAVLLCPRGNLMAAGDRRLIV
jgi:hypothetical protein